MRRNYIISDGLGIYHKLSYPDDPADPDDLNSLRAAVLDAYPWKPGARDLVIWDEAGRVVGVIGIGPRRRPPHTPIEPILRREGFTPASDTPALPGSPAKNPADDELLTKSELAAWMKVSTRQVSRLASTGRLPRPVKVGKRDRWSKSSLIRMIEERQAKRSGRR